MRSRPRVLLAGFFWLVYAACGEAAQPSSRPDDGEHHTGEQAAEVAEVRTDPRYVAVLVPEEAVDIKSKEAGDLIAVSVRPGDRVATGDVVAELDLTPVREALTMAQAEVRSARASLAQREVDIAAAERALEIEQDLANKGIGAQKNVEEARFALERAGKVKDGAAAALAEKQAHIDQLVRRSNEAQIRAPFDGAVALRYRDPGAAVVAGTAIVRLIRVDALWARFAVAPADVVRLAVGDTVRLDIESMAEWLPATVRHISPELDPAAQMVFVDAWLEIPDAQRGLLRAGLPAWVSPTTE
jgi:RND family efflux transporter MFP subunit